MSLWLSNQFVFYEILEKCIESLPRTLTIVGFCDCLSNQFSTLLLLKNNVLKISIVCWFRKRKIEKHLRMMRFDRPQRKVYDVNQSIITAWDSLYFQWNIIGVEKFSARRIFQVINSHDHIRNNSTSISNNRLTHLTFNGDNSWDGWHKRIMIDPTSSRYFLLFQRIEILSISNYYVFLIIWVWLRND